jgi:hypothetical protein
MRAGPFSERVILLIRTFLAKTECWLKRLGEEFEVDVERGRSLFAATIGGTAIVARRPETNPIRYCSGAAGS